MGIGLGGAGNGAVQPVQGDCASASGQAHLVGHFRDRADLCVLALVLGHEQHALVVADVDRQRHAHVGEDDDVVQGDEQKLRHCVFTLLGICCIQSSPSTNYRKCTVIPRSLSYRSRLRARLEGGARMLYGTLTNPARGAQSQIVEPGTRTIASRGRSPARGRLRAPRARYCRVRGTPSGASLPALSAGRSRKRPRAAAATRPASTSDDTPAPHGRYVITATT